MKEFKPVKEGKVREVYDNGDSMIIVATDRISAFDVILKNQVTKKGAILTQMSKFWFDFTKDIVPNMRIMSVKYIFYAAFVEMNFMWKYQIKEKVLKM